MPGFFHDLGSQAGRALRQGNWLLQALTGTEAEAIAAEEAFGRDLAAESLRELKAFDEPDAAAWIDALGAELTARVKNKLRRFRFTIVAAGEPNAFALPGGFIVVEKSLLDLCGWDRDEVAFVLSHEMAHVIKGHTLERLVGARGLARLAGALPIGGPAAVLFRQVGLAFLTSAYSREQEFDADHLGARLAAAAGFDLDGGPRLLARIGAIQATEPGFSLFPYFASHPPLDHRIAALQRLRGRPST